MSTQQQEQQALVEENDELRRKVDGLRQGHGIDAAMEVRAPAARSQRLRPPAPSPRHPHPLIPRSPPPTTAGAARVGRARARRSRSSSPRCSSALLRQEGAVPRRRERIEEWQHRSTRCPPPPPPATAPSAVEYKERGMLDASLAVLSAALGRRGGGPVNGRSQLVDPLSALADLHLKAKREDEAINCRSARTRSTRRHSAPTPPRSASTSSGWGARTTRRASSRRRR